MKLYRKFLLITSVNLLLCFVVMYTQGYAAYLHREAGFKTWFFGYFYWLGIFALIGPLFLNEKDRRWIFSNPFRWGSLFLCIVNAFGPFFVIKLASRLIPAL